MTHRRRVGDRRAAAPHRQRRVGVAKLGLVCGGVLSAGSGVLFCQLGVGVASVSGARVPTPDTADRGPGLSRFSAPTPPLTWAGAVSLAVGAACGRRAEAHSGHGSTVCPACMTVQWFWQGGPPPEARGRGEAEPAREPTFAILGGREEREVASVLGSLACPAPVLPASPPLRTSAPPRPPSQRPFWHAREGNGQHQTHTHQLPAVALRVARHGGLRRHRVQRRLHARHHGRVAAVQLQRTHRPGALGHHHRALLAHRLRRRTAAAAAATAAGAAVPAGVSRVSSLADVGQPWCVGAAASGTQQHLPPTADTTHAVGEQLGRRGNQPTPPPRPARRLIVPWRS
jgi:hypothetical protein